MERLKLTGKSLRCWWCACAITEEPRQVNISMGKKEYQADVCCEHCAEEVRRACNHIRKFFWLFPLGMAVMIFTLSHGGNLSIVGLMIGGATLIVCPFATPQTVEIVGLKRSFLIGRVAGAVLLLGSAAFLIAMKLV